MSNVRVLSPIWILSFVLIYFFQASIPCGAAKNSIGKKAYEAVKFKVTPPELSSFSAEQIDDLLAHKKTSEVEKILAETPVKPGDKDVRHIFQAACYSQQKEPEKAIAEFEKAKRILQAGDHVISRIARAYANESNFEKAIALCDIGIKRSNDEDCLVLRADCYMSQKQYTLAISDYEELARINPKDRKKYHLKASRALVICGKPEQALAQAQAAIQAPGGAGDPSAHLTEAQCFEKLQRYQDALASVTRGYNLARSSGHRASEVYVTTALDARARYYEKLGKKKEAAADRKTLRRFSEGVMSDLVGD